MFISRNRFAELSSGDDGGSDAVLEEPQVELEGAKDPPTTTKKVRGKGKRRKNKRGETTVTVSLPDFHGRKVVKIKASEFDIERATGLSVEPAIKRWAKIPTHLKEKYKMLHKLCIKSKNRKKILEASLCVTKNYEDHPHARPAKWKSPIDTKGNYQITTDGQYTEVAGGVVLKAAFGATIRTAKEILGTTCGPSKKEPRSIVHEYLAAKKGIEFAVELKGVLDIQSIELASDCEAMVDRMNRMKVPGSKADQISQSNLSEQDGREFQIMKEMRDLIVEHFGLDKVTFIHLLREANQVADLIGREVTDRRVTLLLKTPQLYEDGSMKIYKRELKDLLERKNEDWKVVPCLGKWIIYFQERDYNSTLELTDRRTFEDNLYLRFEPVKKYDFVIEKLRHFSQPGTYGN